MLATSLLCVTAFAVGFVSRSPHERESAGPGADMTGAAPPVPVVSRHPSGPVKVGAVTEPGESTGRRASGTAATPEPSGNTGLAPGSVTARGLYRHHSAAYWAWRYRQRTKQLQAERARIKLLKQRLQRHTVTRRVASSNYGVWDRLGSCESGYGGPANWSYNGPSGFDGGLQFSPSTWSAYRLPGYPAYAYQASREQQIAVAERVLRAQGWSAWPRCSAELGLS